MRSPLLIKVDALSRKSFLEGKIAMANSATAVFCGVALAGFVPMGGEQDIGQGVASIICGLYFQLKAFAARREIKGIRMAYGGK